MALSSFLQGARLSARSNNGAANLVDQVLTPQLLAMYQVIVAQDVQNHVYSAAEVLTRPT